MRFEDLNGKCQRSKRSEVGSEESINQRRELFTLAVDLKMK